MIRSIRRLALSLGFTVILGGIFVPMGCGGLMGNSGTAAPGHVDGALPDDVARQVRSCEAEHYKHLVQKDHSIIFDVKLDSDGEVDTVTLRESTLRDDSLEMCIAGALRSLNEDALPTRLAHRDRQDPVAPGSRELTGQFLEAAGACLSAPPCLLAVGVIAAAIAVYVYVYPSTVPGKRKHHPRPAPVDTAVPDITAAPMVTAAPITTAAPIATAVPTAAPVSRKDECAEMFAKCHDIAKIQPKCARVTTYNYDLCEECRNDCQINKAYAYRDCYRCGFE